MKKLLLTLLATASIVTQNIMADPNGPQTPPNPDNPCAPICTSPDRAPKIPKRDKIKQILDMVLGNHEWIPTVMNQLSSQYAKNGQLPEEIMVATQKFQKAMLEDFCSDAMRESIINSYDKIYSDKEISDLLRFYKTETGQKLIKSLPEIMVEMTKLTNGVMQKHLNNYVAEVNEINRRLANPEPKKQAI